MLPDHAETLAEAFGAGAAVAPLVEVARGQQGRVWRLDTASGPVAIKELLIRQHPADAEADVGFQQTIIAAGSVSMPRPIRAVDGGVLQEIGGAQVRAYTWVEVLPSDTRQDPGLVGRTLAAIHRIDHRPAGQLHPWYTEPVGAPRWAALRSAARSADTPFADRLAAEVPHLIALEALMTAPVNLQNCHRDLWADNLLPTPDGGICVVDWENCGLEDPAQEIPMSLIDFGLGDQQRVRDLYAAYRDAGGPGQLRAYGDFTMVIAQFGHFWEQAVTRYLAPDATAEDQDHAACRIAELLATPFRLEQLDDVLDAIVGIG